MKKIGATILVAVTTLCATVPAFADYDHHWHHCHWAWHHHHRVHVCH